MTNVMHKSGPTELAGLLANMNTEGGFSLAVLTDPNGFLIASAALPGQDLDAQSAVIALVQKTAVQVRTQLGMEQTDEISMYDAAGRQLVCRSFDADGQGLILAVLVPHKRQSYRRLTNQTIKAIRRALSRKPCTASRTVPCTDRT
jgi:predicted regulator of Ras-like GTPase activity (Roadblock/LC7/MglB family)